MSKNMQEGKLIFGCGWEAGLRIVLQGFLFLSPWDEFWKAFLLMHSLVGFLFILYFF